MNLSNLNDFVRAWNNQDKEGEKEFMPINRYALHAYMLGSGFTLKWFVTQEEFDNLIVELTIPDDLSGRILFVINDSDKIEIEVDPTGNLLRPVEDIDLQKLEHDMVRDPKTGLFQN